MRVGRVHAEREKDRLRAARGVAVAVLVGAVLHLTIAIAAVAALVR